MNTEHIQLKSNFKILTKIIVSQLYKKNWFSLFGQFMQCHNLHAMYPFTHSFFLHIVNVTFTNIDFIRSKTKVPTVRLIECEKQTGIGFWMLNGYSSASPAVQLWLVWCICINVQKPSLACRFKTSSHYPGNLGKHETILKLEFPVKVIS